MTFIRTIKTSHHLMDLVHQQRFPEPIDKFLSHEAEEENVNTASAISVEMMKNTDE